MLGGLALFFGCDSSSRKGGGDNKTPLTNGVSFAELRPLDVLVRVDGRPLTKKDVELLLDQKIAMMKVRRPEMKKASREELSRRFIPGIIAQFVSKSLYLDAASKEKVVADAKDEDDIRNNILQAYAPSKVKSFDAFLKTFPENIQSGILHQVSDDAKIMAYWRRKAPEAFAFKDSDFKAVEEHVAKLNEKSRAVFKQQKEKAEDIYNKILAGTNFIELARSHSSTFAEDESSGNWGDFTLREIPYPEMLEHLSKLKPGEVTRPLELDDAIHIVRLDSREGHGDESTVNLNPEHLKLSRIVVPLPVTYEVGTTNEVRSQLRRERVAARQKEWLKELRSRAVVEFPSGTNCCASVR